MQKQVFTQRHQKCPPYGPRGHTLRDLICCGAGAHVSLTRDLVLARAGGPQTDRPSSSSTVTCTFAALNARCQADSTGEVLAHTGSHANFM